MSSLIVFNNIKAEETRMDETGFSGQNNIIFKLSSEENFTLYEETALDPSKKMVYNYADDSITKPYVTRSERIEAMLQENIEPISLATEDSLVKPSLISTTTNLKLREKIENYQVQTGDTISQIAQNFGISIKTILWANDLTVRSYIKPGDTLKILPVNGVVHTIKKGDSLGTIAKKYEADIDKIIEYNKLIDADDITIGQDLIIPGGEIEAPKVITTPSYASVPSSSSSGSVYSRTSTAPSAASISGTTLQWPTSGYRITQYYSYRHTGLDIGGGYSSPLYAAESGTVIKAQGGWNGGYGIYVIIDHGGGMKTLYGHASKLFVKVGDQVSRGQTIAMMGSTGRSTGPHIHFEVRINGTRVNPLSYIR